MWYDLAVVVILVLAVLRGAVKGFVWQLASIAAIVLCFVFAEKFSLAVAPHINVEEPLNRWIAMFVLYLVFALVSFGVARLLRGWIEKLKFVEFDRHLGSLFGFVKGVTFCLVLTFFAVTLSERARGHVLESRTGYLAAIIMDRLHPVMPTELREVLEPYIHQLDRDDLDLRRAHHAANDGEEDDHADGHGHQHDENGEPVENGGRESERETPLTGVRETLLGEISGVYSDFPDARAAIVEEIEAAVTGIPDGIALAIFKDWHADLLALSPDPDPRTDHATSLDARIVRHLETASADSWESPALR